MPNVRQYVRPWQARPLSRPWHMQGAYCLQPQVFALNCLPLSTNTAPFLHKAVSSFPTFGATDWGQVSGAMGMMAEVAAAGPIACTLVSDPLDTYTGGVIRKPPRQSTHIDHVVSIVGWGTDDHVPYWEVRNSWGSAWGEGGRVS